MTLQQRNQQQIVAAFDFDGTLTRCDSLLPFLHFSSGFGKFTGYLLQLAPTLVQFLFGKIGNQAAKEAVLARFFAGAEESKITELGARFAHQKLPSLLRQKAMARLRWHQKQGHYCALVSASLDVYLNPWGREMGFDAIICSQLEFNSENRITGRLVDANCYGVEKVRRLRQLVGNPSVLYVYGDSRGDHELLKIADHAYYRYMPDPEDI
jgi:phosphatidylglycerophosphatase C